MPFTKTRMGHPLYLGNKVSQIKSSVDAPTNTEAALIYLYYIIASAIDLVNTACRRQGIV